MLGHVRLNGFFLVGPIVRARAEFDFDDRADVCRHAGREDRRIVEEKTLAVGHVGIDFELPTGFTECALNL